MLHILKFVVPLSMFYTAYAYSFNTLFLEDAPVTLFNEQDTDMMMNNFYQAMDDNADGVSSEWMNPETGHNGTTTPIDTTSDANGTCRRVRVENNAGTNQGLSEFRFCKQEGGQWQAVTTMDQ